MNRSIRPSAVLLTCVVIVAGCGSAGSASSGTAGGNAGRGSTPGLVPTSAPVATSGGAAPGASPMSACELLTDADIKAVTGLSVADKKAKFMSGVSQNGCDWTLSDTNASEVQLAYVDTGGKKFFDTYYAPFNSPLPGFGDAAIRDDVGGVMAVKGDAVVFVTYIEFPATHKDYPAKLLQAALGHLP